MIVSTALALKIRTIPRKSLVLLSLLSLYTGFCLISILPGYLISGEPFDIDFFKAFLDFMELGFDWRIAKFILPQNVPPYFSVAQVFSGMYYTILFPFLMLVFVIIFDRLKTIKVNISKPLLSTLVFVSGINMLFNYVEYLVPALHVFLLDKGGVGDGAVFFSYRGFSLAFHFYVNAFLNMISFSYGLNQYMSKRDPSSALILILSIGAILISGTRVSWIGAGLIIIASLFAFPFRNMYQRLKVIMLIASVGILALAAFALIKPDTIEILMSILTIQDSSGSAQIHSFYFLHSLDMILQYPMGVGIGKSDFGGFNYPGWISTESHVMSLTIGAGIQTLIVFSLINIYLLRLGFLAAKRSSELNWIFPFNISVFLVSFINIQFFESTLPIMVTTILYAILFVEHLHLGNYETSR